MNGDGCRIVLASASPRRRRLFAWLGLPYETASVDTPEDLASPLASDPPALAKSIAEEKAAAARDLLGPEPAIVACDTLVVHEGEVLGKPRDLKHAREMLRSLSGRTHQVVTGCALMACGSGSATSFAVTTPVRMRALSEREIEDWVEKGELLGCAGAYNIEHHLGHVSSGECFQNVAGLPLCHLRRAIRDGALGDVGEPEDPCAECDASRGERCDLGRELSGGPNPPR